MSMGANFYTAPRALAYGASFPYFYSSMVFAIPAGEKYSFMSTIFFPFEYIIWSLIGFIFLATLIVVGGLKLTTFQQRAFVIGQNNDLPFFNMLNICFGGAISRLPTRNFARSLLLIWLVMSLVLQVAYQSKLFHFLRTEQRRTPLFTLDAVYQSNYDLYILETYYQIFYDAMPDDRRRRLVSSGAHSFGTFLLVAVFSPIE